MSNPIRDTKFLGFAKLLWPEIASQLARLDFERATRQDARRMDDRIETLIAQRAYDLVEHAFTDIDYRVEYVPDLTQWPETPDSE